MNQFSGEQRVCTWCREIAQIRIPRCDHLYCNDCLKELQKPPEEQGIQTLCTPCLEQVSKFACNRQDQHPAKMNMSNVALRGQQKAIEVLIMYNNDGAPTSVKTSLIGYDNISALLDKKEDMNTDHHRNQCDVSKNDGSQRSGSVSSGRYQRYLSASFERGTDKVLALGNELFDKIRSEDGHSAAHSYVGDDVNSQTGLSPSAHKLSAELTKNGEEKVKDVFQHCCGADAKDVEQGDSEEGDSEEEEQGDSEEVERVDSKAGKSEDSEAGEQRDLEQNANGEIEHNSNPANTESHMSSDGCRSGDSRYNVSAAAAAAEERLTRKNRYGNLNAQPRHSVNPQNNSTEVSGRTAASPNENIDVGSRDELAQAELFQGESSQLHQSQPHQLHPDSEMIENMNGQHWPGPNVQMDYASQSRDNNMAHDGQLYSMANPHQADQLFRRALQEQN